MFGYVSACWDNLTEPERVRYREVYCGLCRSLGSTCGQRCRLALTYDMAFLAVLLSSLYEPPEARGERRCLPHPVHCHGFVQTPYTAYAADATVALAYHKCLDDWHDDRSVRARAAAKALAGPYRRVRARRERLCAAVEEGMEDIRRLEQAPDTPPDAVANRFGLVMAEVFAPEQDHWEGDLRRFGARLGKFVYVMDAVMDYDDDLASGSYNPFAALDSGLEDAQAVLTSLIASATDAFERLPLEQDIHLMRSVLYAGVWQQYAARFGQTETPTKEEDHG